MLRSTNDFIKILSNSDLEDSIKTEIKNELNNENVVVINKIEYLQKMNIFFESILKTFNYKNFITKKIKNNGSENNICILYIRLNKKMRIVMKIISLQINEYNDIYNEIENSKYINNILTENNCPHFVFFITSIKINKDNLSIDQLDDNNNFCLIYDYVYPWIIEFGNIRYSISRLDDIFYIFNNILFSRSFDQDYIDKILFNIFFQIFYSLCVMKKNNLSHNDLRTANILIGSYYEDYNYFHYKIIHENKEYDYYLENLGFQVKIIDYGLSYSNNIKNYKKKESHDYIMIGESGIYELFTNYYDIHTLINEILSNNDIKLSLISPKLYQLFTTIIDKKYTGIYLKNKYINKYWRLSFPYTIKEYISFNNLESTVKLNYDENHNLIINDNLINTIYNHFIYNKLDEEINDFSFFNVYNMIKDPLDNNLGKILTPIEAIKLFNMFENKPTIDNSKIILYNLEI
jgi:hypothetical protein